MDTIYSGLYIEDDRLSDYALSLARLLPVTGRGSLRPVFQSLRSGYLDIRRCHDAIRRRYGDASSPPAACEWLLDNWYMVRREYLSVAAQLNNGGRVRRSKGEVLILALCRELVQCGHGEVTPQRCQTFLEGFQSVTPLSRRELNLFPAALCGAVIGQIALVCEKLQYASSTELHAQALSALFSSLRLFSVLDTEKLINAADISSAIFSADPSGEYPLMDADTKREYLRRLEALAERRGLEEHVLAKRLIHQAEQEGRHVGFYLFPPAKPGREKLYIWANLLLTASLCIVSGLAFHSLAAALLLLLPVSELVKRLIDYVLLRLISPHPLPRMDMSSGVPPEGRSICVISSILGGDDARRLEELRLASRSEGCDLLFGLLADLPQAKHETEDYDAELLRRARREVERLNRKYGGGFYLFTRGRSFDGEYYCGHERKRGAIIELARLLLDKDSALSVTGDRDALKGLRYIISLDSDTRIYPGSLGELIGAALHPLCRPVIDPESRTVIGGHAILHPKIETELQSSTATDFALIFAGVGGSDPYGGLCGELYMDAFGCGGFSGKGLIDAAALLCCADSRFPSGRILSHDALEGAYLRGGYMGNASFSDRFPPTPIAYFKRLHRWVRGDWQNAPWIFKKELRAIDRFRLFDSLRRSLLPPATFAAITLGFFLKGQSLKVAAWAALLALLANLLIALAESAVAQRSGVRLRRHAKALTGAGGAMVQTFIRLWLLPHEAFVCLWATAAALWRMLVSKKRLLQWQTAAQSERGDEGLACQVRAMWFPVVLGVLLMAFSPEIIGKASGFMWLLSPAAAAALALPAYKDASLGEEDRQYIIEAASESWRYLSEFSSPEDNFLPPDNFQEQPPVGLAHRSSPTNMGLALAAAVAAADMGIITREDAAAYIGRSLSTLEKLPRLLGHFYNWYDTRSLKPLLPAYISTVDSGNMYAGLLTAREALTQWGKPELSARISALMADMDFSPLYDRDRGLFYICYDAAKGRGAGGWYDLLASESMLTSYLAIAKGDVPKKHWRRLSRAQLQKDGYRGLASWTGTMFEYLMPALFLPVYRGSLLYESGRFCVYAQKRRAFPGKPWGISESAFYSLDPSLSYRYKAHGCPALALKRGQEADMVISTYSSFLALSIDPRSGARNLRRLAAFGAVGRYGYMEALDFTPGRCRSDSGEQVRCYMAHHVSMSIIAAANAVCDNSVSRRFMGDGAMNAYSLLLQEKLPDNALVLRRDISEAPEKPRRDMGGQWLLRGGSDDRELRCCLLSNGAYNILLSNTGQSSASLGELCVYGEDPLSPGIELLCGDEAITPASQLSMWELGEDTGRFSLSHGNVDCAVAVSAAGGDCGELRTVELRSRQEQALILSLRFRPILARLADYKSHPAYWQLGLEAESEENSLLLHRLPRGDSGSLWLCLSCGQVAELSPEPGGSSSISRPFVDARVSLRLESGKTHRVDFALCLSPQREEALAGARRILRSRGLSPGNMPSAAAIHLGMSQEEVGAAMAMAGVLWQNPLHEAAARRELWQYGISGDLPLICCDGRASESDKLLRRFCLLKSCGMNSELVFFSDETGEYLQPLLRRLSQSLSSVGLESLIGSPGGVYFVPSDAAPAIKSRAALVIGEEEKALQALPRPSLSLPREPLSLPSHCWHNSSFEYYVNQNLPSRTWQHVLTNGSFGYIAADCGIGNMWLDNAREMRIDSPPDCITAVSGAEQLYIKQGDRLISLFAANDGLGCLVRYGAGYAVWEKELDGRRIKTTAFIPDRIDARILLIEGAEGLSLTWGLELVFGAGDSSGVVCREEGGIVTVQNPEAYISGKALLLSSSVPARPRLSFVPAAAELSMICDRATVLVCGCCSKQELFELCKPNFAIQLLSLTAARWEGLAGRFRLRSPVAALDRYMSFWSAYQAIACRLCGRSSLYQSGGAFGFRDQLQDSVNLMLLSPSYAREQIISCCRHQYVEGDVMHWWHSHPQGDKGVRTRCSDDMLWLAWALCEYVEATGDCGLCDMPLPYISSPPLKDEEKDRYEKPESYEVPASVLDHARAALECCIRRGFGPHGLPYIGSGDWNDAINDLGGESVWLGWFFSCCADSFADLLQRLGKADADRYRRFAQRIGSAADGCFNGSWYLRGYYGDGEALGDKERIDSLPQSWAAFSRRSTPSRRDAGIQAALERLVDSEHSIIKLFDPPYSAARRSPGYITGYGQGFRENGGQYTHGAVWLAMAAINCGHMEEGFSLLQMLLPEEHDLRRYGAEPFVLPADVYSAPGHQGEAGWTWYTGAAGWYFRAVTQCVLGLKLRDGRLTIRPELPNSLGDCHVYWRDLHGGEHRISIAQAGITVDGEPYLGGEIG